MSTDGLQPVQPVAVQPVAVQPAAVVPEIIMAPAEPIPLPTTQLPEGSVGVGVGVGVGAAVPAVQSFPLATILKQRDESMPEYIEDADELTNALGAIIRPPTLRICQQLSKKLKEAGIPEGDIVLLTQASAESIGNMSTPLLVVPVFWFTEYLAMNPRKATTLARVRERTYDATSVLAQKCKNRIEEACPELPTEKIQYNETLTFIVYIVHLGLAAAVSFMRGEYVYGSNFANLIKRRGVKVFAGCYELCSGKHQNRAGDEWYGFDARNPINGNPKWVSQDLYEYLKNESRTLQEAFEKNSIEVDMDIDTDNGNAFSEGPTGAQPSGKF